jgi:hypothetical protein
MAYDLKLTERIRAAIAGRRNFTELKMFGGVAFMLRGNLCVAIWKDPLILRLGLEQAEEALREPFVRDFDITGKPMRGWVLVSAEGVADDDDLSVWLERAVQFVRKLPAKVKHPR